MKKKWKRTPKHYDGPLSSAKSLGSLCNLYLEEMKDRNFSLKEEVFKAWYGIIGVRVGPLTMPLSFEKGVLTVRVQSSTLYTLLCTQDKEPILSKLKEKFPNQIKDVKFWFG